MIWGIAGMLLCAYIWISSAEFPNDAVMKIGPDFFPRIMAMGMGIASAALLLQAVFVTDVGTADKLSVKDPNIQRAVIVFVAAVIYVFVMEWLGFIVDTVIFMVFMMYMLKFRNYLRMVVISLVTALAVLGAFEGLLDIQLPMGIMEFFMD